MMTLRWIMVSRRKDGQYNNGRVFETKIGLYSLDFYVLMI